MSLEVLPAYQESIFFAQYSSLAVRTKKEMFELL